MKWSEPCTLEDFVQPIQDYFDANNLVEAESQQREVLSEDVALLKQFGIEQTISEYPPADFQLILEGCQTMQYAADNNELLNYDQWCAALSVANACEDFEGAVKQLSENHPDYNQSVAEHKAAEFLPSTCGRMRDIFASCAGCERSNNSPYGIGFSMPSEHTIDGVSKAVSIMPFAGATVADEFGEFAEQPNGVMVDGFDIEYPAPYILTTGGIHVKVEGDKSDYTLTICQYPIRFVARTSDFALGEDVAKFQILFPQDGWRDFTLKLRDTVDSKGGKVCSELASQGCIIPSKEQKYMGEFVSAYLQSIINKMAAAKNYAQLGWADDGNVFVLSDKSVNLDGTHTLSGMSSTIAPISKAMKKRGTLEDWLKVINVYARDGYEPYAFGHSIAYGSLLFRFTDYEGAVVSLLGNSGSGKSTILKTINSVFGHPKDLMLQQRDNEVAKFVQIAAMNNIAPCYDEISNIEPKELSDLCYGISQGRDKRRGAQKGGLRDDELTWCCIMPVTSNHSLYERLGTLKSDASAEAMRVFEYHVRTDLHQMGKRESQDTFEPLSDNYGHAGEIFVTWLMQNKTHAKERVKYWFNRFDEEANVPSNERYWSAIVGATLAGAEMSAKLGLNTFDVEKLFKFSLEQVVVARGSVNDNKRSPSALLVDFMNSQIRSTIVLGGGTVDKGKDSPLWVKQEPSNGLQVRIEIDKNVAYVSRAAIRRWITEGGGDYFGIRAELMNKKILLSEKTDKVLSAGSQTLKTGQLPCWLIDLNHREMSGGAQLQVIKLRQTDEKVVANGDPF
jgi:energy-coupling factor transporter ATP-binding protein EcfA2